LRYLRCQRFRGTQIGLLVASARVLANLLRSLSKNLI